MAEVSYAKMAEPIEVLLGFWAGMGPGNYVLDGRPDHPIGMGNFEGVRRPIVKYRDTVMSCAKMAEPIEMPFGIWTREGPRKHVLGGTIGCTLAQPNTIAPSIHVWR